MKNELIYDALWNSQITNDVKRNNNHDKNTSKSKEI